MRRVFLFVFFFALWSMVCLSMNHRGVNTSHCLFENHRTFGIFKKKNPRSLYLYLFQSTWEVSSTSEHWVCLCECGADSLPTLQYSVVKEFPMWWQMLWNSKMGLFFLNPLACIPVSLPPFLTSSVFSPPPLPLPLFPSLCIPSQWNEEGWPPVRVSNRGIIVTVSYLPWQCVGPDPSCFPVSVLWG